VPTVTNVVFDIGNVLIRWDPHLLYDPIFGDRADATRFLAEICDPAWNLEQDLGRSIAEGIAERIERYPHWIDEIRAWDERWHEMVPGVVEGMPEILEQLRADGVPTFAISNFSAEKYAETVERFPFLGGFRDAVVSAHVRLIKPDPAIFRLFLDRNGLDPADCLFVDDVPANVEGARGVGLRAVTFESAERFRADLAEHGIRVGG
jgi:2-haloacid dehalogenase